MSRQSGRTVLVTAGSGSPYDGIFHEFLQTKPTKLVALIEDAGGVIHEVDLTDFHFTDAPVLPIQEFPIPSAKTVRQFQHVTLQDGINIILALTWDGGLYLTQRKAEDVHIAPSTLKYEDHTWRLVLHPYEAPPP